MKNVTEIIEIYNTARAEKLTEHKSFLEIEPFLSEIYDEEGISALTKTMQDVADVCCVKAKDAEVFGKGFFKIIAGGGDSLVDDEAIFFEKLVDKFPNSVKLAEMLADVYGAIINETENNLYSEKLENLAKNNPALENVALQSLYALVDNQDIDVLQYAKAVDKAKDIYLAHKKIDFATSYADGLKYLVYKQDEESALKTIATIKDLLDTWNDSFIESHYFDALSKLTWEQDENGCLETIKVMESYWPQALNKNSTAMHLAYTLSNYSLCVEGAEKKAVIDKIENLSSYWTPAKNMAHELANGTYQYAHKPSKAGKKGILSRIFSVFTPKGSK